MNLEEFKAQYIDDIEQNSMQSEEKDVLEEESIKSLEDIVENKVFNQEETNVSNDGRRKYKIFSQEVKEKCLEELNGQGGPRLKAVSKKYGVPVKSLRRWLKVGPVRKQGAGRKLSDPIMEKKLLDWYKNHHLKKRLPVNSKLIQSMAMFYSSNNNFRASKGWLEKFKKRHHLP